MKQFFYSNESILRGVDCGRTVGFAGGGEGGTGRGRSVEGAEEQELWIYLQTKHDFCISS